MNENIDAIFDLLDTLLASNKVEYSAYSALHDQISFLSDSLKEQEPVKPIKLENWWQCPSCGGNIVANMSYCPKCGRVVKWDD